jgi:perosamine synthetase
MTNLQAAIGCAQMERIDDFVFEKRKLADFYNQLLAETDFFILPPQESWAINGYWLYTAILKENSTITRDEFMSKMLKNGVETRPVFYPLHEMPPYKNYPTKSTFENSKFISKQGISFPSSVNITDAELNNIRSAFQVIFDSVKA